MHTEIDTPLMFRFHKGSLEESMDTMIEIKSLDHLLAEIALKYSPELTFIGLQIEPNIFDEGVGWGTHVVRGVLQVDPVICYPVGSLNRRPSWISY